MTRKSRRLQTSLTTIFCSFVVDLSAISASFRDIRVRPQLGSGLLACALCVIVAASVANAQVAEGARLVEGRVARPGKEQPVPVPDQWVVLHRVGSDRAGPVDSTKTGADGRFRIRYRASGVPDALYFVSARYSGIAYFSPPLRTGNVRGGDGDIIVYPTTSDTAALHVQGHHIVVSAARGRRREIAEVFELDNDGTSTIVARDSVTPLWSTSLPREADSVSVSQGDIGAGAVALRKGRADVYAPISPGVRQLVLTYLLPADAFPVSWPLQRATSVLEVLAEDPRARVEGARLTEVASAAIEGRPFRRFLARDVASNAVVRIDAPKPGGTNRSALRVLAFVIAAVMLGALALWRMRGRRGAPAVMRIRSEDLIAELATLDARFERNPSADASARAEYERDRADLKARIASALAEEQTAR